MRKISSAFITAVWFLVTVSSAPSIADSLLSAENLSLTFTAEGKISSLTLMGDTIPLTGAPQFQLREVTNGVDGSGFYPMNAVRAADENNSLQAEFAGNGFTILSKLSSSGLGIRCTARITSDERRDRSLVLRWILPVDCTGWQWAGALGEAELIDNGSARNFSNVEEAKVRTSENGGLNTSGTGGVGNGSFGDKVGMGEYSPYPMACVFGENAGIGIGIDLDHPAVYRLSYIPGTGLAIEFDIGVSPKTFKFPNSAVLSWVIYSVDPIWEFRSAIEGYYSLFPECFDKRVEREGIWMPFVDITKVEGFEDFGFMFHETFYNPPRRPGDSTIADTDRDIGVYSFQYVEPWDIQIAAKKDGLSYDGAVSEDFPSGARRESILRSVAFDTHDQWIIRVMYAPWFPSEWAVSYTTNTDPDLGAGSRYDHVKKTSIDPAIAGGFDGVYFDSWEFFWPFDLNYRTDHYNTADYPLTFSASLDKPRPAIWHYSSEYEMGRAVADSLHAIGKLTMGNGFYNIPFTAGIMDLFGCEFEWPGEAEQRVGRWAYFRTMAAAKPIVVLLNKGMYTDAFMKEPYEGYEVYFKETLFWGVFPSFFSPDAARDPYWQNAEMYNTGRPWFKRYIPLIREIASAGWQPVTGARVTGGSAAVERFGFAEKGAVYLTLRDLKSEYSGTVTVAIDSATLAAFDSPECLELTGSEKVRVRKNGDGWTLKIKMKKGDTKVLKLF